MSRWLGAALGLLLAACGGQGPEANSPDPREQPLELELIDEAGRTLQLSQLRGRPALLFLFATYDPTSQLALTGLLRKLEGEGSTTALGIAVQPDAKTFLPPFRKVVEPAFPLYIDAHDALLHGKSALGRIPGVPAFVALDAAGRVKGTYYGIASQEQLDALIEEAQ